MVCLDNVDQYEAGTYADTVYYQEESEFSRTPHAQKEENKQQIWPWQSLCLSLNLQSINNHQVLKDHGHGYSVGFSMSTELAVSVYHIILRKVL